jgi:hypothetical protein
MWMDNLMKVVNDINGFEQSNVDGPGINEIIENISQNSDDEAMSGAI